MKIVFMIQHLCQGNIRDFNKNGLITDAQNDIELYVDMCI